jgi:uncharacterized protein YprB with RNaseH-like and TPR domain
MVKRAYIDIETTGLSRYYCEITVIGVGFERAGRVVTVQLMENNLTERKLVRTLKGIDRVYTYNGSRFDLPFIKAVLNVDLKQIVQHRDLMYDCWRHNLKGGLKAVERRLRIKRRFPEIDGHMAVRLWWRYYNDNDRDALDKLLLYNRQDVTNLKKLRLKLGVS